MHTITVHAKLRGRAPSNLPRASRILEIAHLDVAIPPTAPIYIGLRVRVHVLKKRSLVNDEQEYHEPPTTYLSTLYGIEGPIVGIKSMELAVTEFIVRNEEETSLVEHAYLSVQHLPGVTVHLGLWRSALRTLLIPLLEHTRHVPLDVEAIVVTEGDGEVLDRRE